MQKNRDKAFVSGSALQLQSDVLPAACLPAQLVINSVDGLMAAEEMLDSMDAGLVDKTRYAELYQKADAYVRATPSLLDSPWKRNGGAIHDLIESIRQERADDITGVTRAPLPALGVFYKQANSRIH